jgi:hypothetical protein
VLNRSGNVVLGDLSVFPESCQPICPVRKREWRWSGMV